MDFEFSHIRVSLLPIFKLYKHQKKDFMRKLLLAFSIAAISFGSAKAQDASTGFHIAGGARLALPVGNFGDVAGFGFGAELQGEYNFSENVSGVVSAGYTNFTGKTVTYPEPIGEIKTGSAGFIPVLAGVRFYPSSNVFVGAKAGISFGTATGAGSAFTYEPQVGYNAEKFQLALGYNAMSNNGTAGSIGLSALFKFN